MNNKEKIKKYKREWYKKNKEKIKEQKETYYTENKEKILIKRKNQYNKKKDDPIFKEKRNEYSMYQYNKKKDNPIFKEKKNEYNKQYRKDKKEIMNKIYKNQNKKIKETPFLRLSKNISRAIRNSIRNKNRKHWENIVSYTLNELIEHLENTSEFTIQDYLEKDLHLDHIIPISVYNFNSFEDEEFKKCWNLKNLRIILAKENLRKNNKLDMELVEKFNIKDLLPLGERI